ALREGRRYVGRDLNRLWTEERVRELREARTPAEGGTVDDGGSVDGGPGDRDVEAAEQRALLDALDRAVAGSSGPVYVLDLHTTSSSGGAFTTVADTLPNRTFALRLPVPLILGLEELVDGTLLEYLGERGYVTAALESGQHLEDRAVDRAVAGVWIAVAAAGLLPERAVPGLREARRLLARDSRKLPRVLEMRYRHALEPGDGFRMHAGYRNFRPVEAGEPLAVQWGEEVTAPESARILMPLYQEQGEDGFFIVREFRPFWLHLSTLLRRLRLGRVVHWLPGIRRHPDREGVLVVDRRVARWYALQVLHLLGFRRQREHGDLLVVMRRRWDRFEPEPPEGPPGSP
ncbi:MAG TPA: hypothetical protein VLL48_13855, partial [Longimicrobiales bacterium]|nr:hypothetical protein [Longimicrobiales bacterium]